MTERAILNRLEQFPMPESEQKQWQMDVLMNAFLGSVDTELIKGALYIDAVSTQELTEEAVRSPAWEIPTAGPSWCRG